MLFAISLFKITDDTVRQAVHGYCGDYAADYETVAGDDLTFSKERIVILIMDEQRIRVEKVKIIACLLYSG